MTVVTSSTVNSVKTSLLARCSVGSCLPVVLNVARRVGLGAIKSFQFYAATAAEDTRSWPTTTTTLPSRRSTVAADSVHRRALHRELDDDDHRRKGLRHNVLHVFFFPFRAHCWARSKKIKLYCLKKNDEMYV